MWLSAIDAYSSSPSKLASRTRRAGLLIGFSLSLLEDEQIKEPYAAAVFVFFSSIATCVRFFFDSGTGNDTFRTPSLNSAFS